MTELKINNIPSPTWHFLKMNDARVRWELPIKGAAVISTGADSEISLNNAHSMFPKSGSDVLFENSPSVLSVTANENEQKQARIAIDDSGESSSAVIYINAKKNSRLTVFINISGGAFAAVRVCTQAKDNSDVKLVFTQLTDDGGRLIAEIYSLAEKSAKLSAAHFFPGSAETYIDSQTLLKGDESTFTSDTMYLCESGEHLDMNYVVLHEGRRTSCDVRANGVLGEGGDKTFRGTIDLRHGSCGSFGNETENVLLLSDEVRNKTLPVILCSEEDVNGAHGATVGDISDEALLYFASRGLSRKLAEQILKDSVSQSFCRLINDDETTRAVNERTKGGEEV